MLKDRENWGMSGRLILTLTAAWVAQVTGECGIPPSLTNGFLAEKFSSITSFPVDAKVFYSCYPGYSLKEGSSRTITCQADSTWGPIQTSCEPRNCGNPGEIMNGYYTANATTLGSEAAFFCEKGYQMVGRNYRVCTANGWDGQVPRCDIVTCNDPPPISNGKVTAPPSGDTWASGNVAQYSCNGDYSLIGEEQLTCTVSGTWDKEPPNCKVVQCRRPSNLENGAIVAGFGPTYKYRETITYRCNKGYEMVGPNVIECSENNMFVPSAPTCRSGTAATTAVSHPTTKATPTVVSHPTTKATRPTTKAIIPPTTTAVEVKPGHQTGTIIGIVIGVIAIVAVIIVLCYCCKKKKEGEYTTSEKVAMNLQSEQVQEKSNCVDC
ncbi:membrane cofactor protein-like isoform X5 [Scyliorhinus canicula]|uniref:membrane cofactor protein-like isoform X5 n=1 Tax=Scyliorhinus canicula TaxID=7830 RepID=UPI0018F5A5CD|nr:membrane cofactor protein-like isoform X5 [Scyliorhinus canicula]